ncbi:GPI mannosyltransferase 2 [Xylaria bambusicola]|uniref:GPI mannosyltransferase 2 n=1 Tax=Xylaria bambusicola TaxID=326684 RepID=UPI002007ECAB|nr:GPI mannosyltransferase 2 [Xylaria bambusicola]KAI0518032.1 GPI mannosyltransferase 2 [Xylaria bambusicola]
MMPFIDAAHPLRSLGCIFVFWKLFLFSIALGSAVGPAYDTSSTLLLSPDRSTYHESIFDLATRLTRWDAIYFVQASRRGYLFEQEWAFASGLPTVVSFLANVLLSLGVEHNETLESSIAIFVANMSHLLSALVLYELGLTVWKNSRVSFVAAVLHILSPGGLFLSAPYSESPYALLSFLGYLFFAKATLSEKRTVAHDASLVAAGLWFGFAVNFRSNGIFNGILFAIELLRELSQPPTTNSVRRRLALIAGGSALAIGFVAPQIVAYQTYCYDVLDSEIRPWCTKRLPSIYTFVQEHYWNVGFLRYWTPGNIPLFLLAAPMLYLLAKSGTAFLSNPFLLREEAKSAPISKNLATFIHSMVLGQLIIAVLAITNYHIQIITRISSGYPLWYWWLASVLSDNKTAGVGKNFVMHMVMYAGIQGALFASFLPPA